MGIFLLAGALILFENQVKKNGPKAAYVLNLALVVYIVFSIILNDYLQYVYGWEYGVAGADLLAHFEGARALAEGTRIIDLHNVAYRFEMSFSGITYILYALLVKIISFSPVIVSYRISLHLMYTLQMIAAVLAADNLCTLFRKEKEKYNYILLFVILSCVCVAQQASILMRDIWVFYFLTLLFKNSFDSRKDIIVGILILAICALLRLYTIILTIPFFAWKTTKKIKTGIVASFAILMFFLAGQKMIYAVAIAFGIKWEFDFNFNIESIIRYFLFPNIMTQTHNVQHMSTNYHAIFGGNTEWIYYMLSCWNVYVYPLACYGIFKTFTNRKKIGEGIIWLCQIINIGLLYSVFYDSVTEPRHKLLILFGVLFFFNEGIRKLNKKAIIVYSFAVVSCLMGIFAFVG